MEKDMLTGLIIALVIAGIIVSVLFFVAEWRIFTKAGEKGWKALIPFYIIFCIPPYRRHESRMVHY